MKIKWWVCVGCGVWLFIAPGAEGFMKGKMLKFEWDYAQAPEDIGGFRLYGADVSGGVYKPVVDILWSEVLEDFSAERVVEVEDGVTTIKYFVLRAFDIDGNESVNSNEVFAIIDFEGPVKPYSLTVTVVPVTIE